MTLLSEILGIELTKFTIENMTEKQWRALSDEELKNTQSFADIISSLNDKTNRDMERLRNAVNNPKPSEWQQPLIEGYKKEIEKFETLTTSEVNDRRTEEALLTIKNQTVYPGEGFLNQKEWEIAKESVLALWKQDGDEPHKAMREFVKRNEWQNIEAAFSGGHDSGYFESVTYTKKGDMEGIKHPLNINELEVYSCRFDNHTLTPSGWETKGKILNLATLMNARYISMYSPLNRSLTENFGSFANHPSVNGVVTYYAEPSEDEDEDPDDPWEPYDIEYSVYGRSY